MSITFYLIFDFFMVLFGGYVIGQYTYLIRTHKLRKNLLLPKSMDVDKCNDKDEFIKYISNRQLLFGIGSMICGIADILISYAIATTISIAVFAALCIWFEYVVMKKAFKEYWESTPSTNANQRKK